MPKKVSLSPYQKHKAEWINCKRCELHETRNKVCLYRGKIPCDVLFIGEAPGQSENELGIPFVQGAPGGSRLEKIIANAQESTEEEGVSWTFGITNVIGCIPFDETGTKVEQPPWEAIQACQPRFIQIVRLADPKLIIAVGKVAAENLREDMMDSPTFHKKIPRVTITHPAAIARSPIAVRALMMQREAVVLEDAVMEFLR